ncbi:MAG: hypothetical protein V4519_01215 [Patescibacteria group bacterium]
MYIKKQLEDGGNKIIWKGNVSFPEKMINIISKIDTRIYPLLKGIASYEDTYFNSQQTKDLIEELQSFKDSLTDEKDKEEIESLVKFAKDIDMQEHLVFVGD